MEKISEFFKELKIRVSSPFFISFAISWLVINWKVPVALFFYSQEELINDGYRSYFDLIEKIYSSKYFVLQPLALAFFYSFGYPVLKNLIHAVQVWADSKGETLGLNLSKAEKIPIDKYLSLRQRYNQSTQKLQNIIEQESLVANNLASARKELDKVQAENESLRKKLEAWDNSTNEDIISGTWKFKIVSRDNETFVIKFNGQNFVNQSDRSPFKNRNLMIRHFIYDSRAQKIYIALVDTSLASVDYHLFNLKFDETKNIMSGILDENDKVEFIKISE